MSRFNNPKEVHEWALRAAKGDIELSILRGNDMNPYCTQGARNDWQRGFDNVAPHSWEGPMDYCTHYQRGKACAELLKG